MAGNTASPDQPHRPSELRPHKRKAFSLGSFGLGLVGVVAFILFVLVRYGWVGTEPGTFVVCNAQDCSAGTGFLFDWLPAVIAFAAVAGGLAATFGRKGSTLRRVGAYLAVLNVFLALAALMIWVAWQNTHMGD